MPFNRVKSFVQSFDAKLNPIHFEESTSTVEEAAEALGVESAQIAKSILFRSKDNRFALVVTAGDVRVNQKKLREFLGSKPKMASPEEVEDITGYHVGGVCPFALKKEIPILLDESMQRFEVVYTAAGTASSALPITFNKLKKITGGCPISVQ